MQNHKSASDYNRDHLRNKQTPLGSNHQYVDEHFGYTSELSSDYRRDRNAYNCGNYVSHFEEELENEVNDEQGLQKFHYKYDENYDN